MSRRSLRPPELGDDELRDTPARILAARLGVAPCTIVAWRRATGLCDAGEFATPAILAALLDEVTRLGVRGFATATGTWASEVSRFCSGKTAIGPIVADRWLAAARAARPDPDASVQPGFGRHGSTPRAGRNLRAKKPQ